MSGEERKSSQGSSQGREETMVKATGNQSPRRRQRQQEGFMAGCLWSVLQRHRKLLCSFHLRELSLHCLGLSADNENQGKG